MANMQSRRSVMLQEQQGFHYYLKLF